MIKLSKICFTDERGTQLTYEIPKEEQIKFDFTFGSLKEEVGFAGGYIMALLPKDDKFLESHEISKRFRMSKFGFTNRGKAEVWFTIPSVKSYSFHVLGNDQK